MSQFTVRAIDLRSCRFSQHEQTIASNLEDCVAFILARISTILFHFTRLLSACYLRYVSLSAYPTVPETN